MADPETNNAPETPQETPSGAQVAEGANEPQGTPASSNPEGGQPTPTEKDKSQVEADRAHWQQKFQEERAKLAALTSQPAAQPETPAQAQAQFQQQQPSREEMNQMLESDPMLGYAAVTQHLVGHVDQLFNRKFAEIERRGEERDAQAAFNNFCTSCNVTPEEKTDAEQYVQQMGIQNSNLSPRAIKTMMADRINYNRMVSGNQKQAMEAAAQASQAAKQQAMTIQPDGGAPPQPTGPKTVEEAIAGKFGRSRAASVLDQLSEGKVPS